jgi:exodeoxyribonuclease VII small subunit
MTAKTDKTNQNFDFKKAIEELEQINLWFQEEDIDLDEGLEKLKKGKELISKCQTRLKKAETEFISVKEDLENEEIVYGEDEDLGLEDLELDFED